MIPLHKNCDDDEGFFHFMYPVEAMFGKDSEGQVPWFKSFQVADNEEI